MITSRFSQICNRIMALYYSMKIATAGLWSDSLTILILVPNCLINLIAIYAGFCL